MDEPLVAALELGGSKALCAVGLSGEHILAERRVETRDSETTLAEVEAFFAPYRPRLRALGIASFGPLELRREAPTWGCMLETPKPGWSNADIAPRLGRALDVPVAIDTDVNGAAMAEHALGALRGARQVVYITVGTGIGVGVLIDGKPLHGLMHPELGHVRAADLCDFVGVCPFHNRCLEGVASAPALRARLGFDPERARDDDPVWDLEARYLGQLVALVVLAYSPDRIALGGGVLSRTGLLSRVRASVLRELSGYIPRPELSPSGIEAYLVSPGLGTRAGLIGAFQLALGSDL